MQPPEGRRVPCHVGGQARMILAAELVFSVSADEVAESLNELMDLTDFPDGATGDAFSKFCVAPAKDMRI